MRDPANASLAHLSIISRDPLSVAAPPWPGPAASLWDPLSLGVDEDGNAVSIGLPERNVLLGGEPGAGKSAALSLFIAAAALDPAVRLTLMDGKQVELAPWSGSAEHFVGPDMADAIEVLKDLCAEMDRRYSVLLASGLRKIERDGEFGLHVVAIDELAFYMRGGTKDERTELTETLRDLISRGRAAGMIVIAATQKPSNDIVPTFVRDLFCFRMALRCTTPEASDTILGQGWAKEGYSASTLGPDDPGRGLPARRGGGPGQDPHPLPRRRRHRRAGRQRRVAEGPVVSSAAHWRSVLAEVDQAGSVLAPGPPARRPPRPHDRRAGRGRAPRPVQGPPGRRLPVVLPPLPGRRLAAGGRRDPGRQGSRRLGGRAPPALRHLHRSLVRPGAPSGRPRRARARVVPAPAQRHLSRTGARSRVGCATAADAVVLGDPLCPECFDYRGAVLWNAHVPRLWERTLAPPLPPGGPGRRAQRRRSCGRSPGSPT